ncbi:hypothetical protein PI124_g23453 [Phytophthora idaei]|nr:hypothetical protein PI125_g25605 [Phytophthora idaei]KAG3123913.1 hypothetical protein PI126_g23485 [Phytophthora idaei]KAG3231451.1 hypothetical protein PI124_g23453 [Phytophthora idaei]
MGWQGRSWVYYKSMMEIAFEDKGVLPCVTGDATLASNTDDGEKKVFSESQAKVKQLIMASLSMELGQRVMMKETGTDMWKYLEELHEGKQNDATRTNQEIILFNKLQPAKGKPNWDVAQPVDNIFMTKAQL